MRKIFLTATILSISTMLFAQTDSASIFLQKGLDEKAKGRLMESLKQFEKAYSYNKNDKQIVRELAATYVGVRRYGQAREKYLQLEQIAPSVDVYKQIMLLSFNMRMFEDAIKYANALKKLDPNEKVSYYLGKANYEREFYGDAIKYLDAAA